MVQTIRSLWQVGVSQEIIRTSTQLKLRRVDHSTDPAVKPSRLQSTVSEMKDTVQQTAPDLLSGHSTAYVSGLTGRTQYSKQHWTYRQATVQQTSVDLQAGHSIANSSGLTGRTQYSQEM